MRLLEEALLRTKSFLACLDKAIVAGFVEHNSDIEVREFQGLPLQIIKPIYVRPLHMGTASPKGGIRGICMLLINQPPVEDRRARFD